MRLLPRRSTLVDLVDRDIARADEQGPDWPTVVEDAVLRQDLEWVLAQLAADVAQDDEDAARNRGQDAEQPDQDGDDDDGVAGGTAGIPGLLLLRGGHAAECGGPAA